MAASVVIHRAPFSASRSLGLLGSWHFSRLSFSPHEHTPWIQSFPLGFGAGFSAYLLAIIAPRLPLPTPALLGASWVLFFCNLVVPPSRLRGALLRLPLELDVPPYRSAFSSLRRPPRAALDPRSLLQSLWDTSFAIRHHALCHPASQPLCPLKEPAVTFGCYRHRFRLAGRSS